MHRIIKSQMRTASSTSASNAFKRIAIGTNRLSSPQPEGTFPSVLATAIQNNINTFESKLDKEEELRRAIVDALMFLSNRSDAGIDHIGAKSLKVIGKISYQTSSSDQDHDQDEKNIDIAEGNILQEKNDDNMVFHNLSPKHIINTMNKSPLVELYQNKELPQVDLIYCAHNPEAQGMEMLQQEAPLEDVRGFVKDKLIAAFVTMEQLVGEGKMGSYGVCSNGLGLSSSHPMHLSWEDMLDASAEASREVHGFDCGRGENNMSTVQLPANLLETHGLKVANRMKQFLASPDASMVGGMPESVEIHSLRPLTCYPDRGTGTGHPFKLVDYMLPTVEDGSVKAWSHTLKNMPAFYTSLLNETMSHFDATHLIELKEEEGRELTVEERETLDGCKLLQSMIHDLDSNLSAGQFRSFAAYEDDLFNKVVPLIHDSFEELDSDSAELLQRFFQAHGVAVRQSLANTTRELLKAGGDGVGKYDIPDDMTLQDFALRFLLEQRCDGEFADGPLIDRVIVGCSRAEHVIEAVQSADEIKTNVLI